MTPPRTVDQIRKAYLDFFQAKGHLVVPSASLIPAGDPTLLLTSAGMVPFKPYFTGAATPPNPRLASVQKCFRTSDIDAVGDPKHLTFFEMLGNFSIGDYFKREAIAWAWEFVTDALGLPPENLWITYYKPALSNVEGEGDQEDLEARGYWLEATKGRLPESHIVPLGTKYNWWGPAGEEGPCGPCSEIHYSYDPANTTIDDLTGDSPRAVEIWNLVFTQFYGHRDGRRTPLPKPNIDTGMGLERTAAVMQGVRSVYDTDAFDYLVKAVARLAHRRYGHPSTRSGQAEATDHAIRVAAEHARGVAFLIADGVVPSNEGRGYVLRRILRRAVRFARKAGIQKTFLADMAGVVIERMGDHYPELRREREFILSVVQGEEERFGQTLDAGTEVLETQIVPASQAAMRSIGQRRSEWEYSLPAAVYEYHEGQERTPLTVGDKIALLVNNLFGDLNATANRLGGAFARKRVDELEVQVRGFAVGQKENPATRVKELLDGLERSADQVSGSLAFVLYDTYGFPVDITQDIAREHGMSVDMEGFQQEMEAQRERGRAAARFGLGDKTSPDAYRQLALGGARFTGYESLSEETVVIGLLVGGAPAERAAKGDRVEVILRESPFYAEAGGQVGDTGEIRGPSGTVRVADTQAPLQGVIAHLGEVVEGQIAVGDPVHAAVDADRRSDIVRNHTATHLLHAALRKILGSHVRQAGSLVAPDRLRFDFSHPSSVGQADLYDIETLVNDKVLANLPVAHQMMRYSEAMAQGALAFFGDKYGDIVRTCRIGGEPNPLAPFPEREGGRGTEEVFSFELCGGTHADATGQIGLVHLESEGSIGAGARRVEAVTGRGAQGLLRERHLLMESLAKQLQTAPGDLASRVGSLLEELDRERKRGSAMERDMARRAAESLPAQVEVVDGVPVLAAQVPASSAEALRDMGDWLKAKLGSAVIVLGALIDDRPAFVAMVTPDLVARGYHAGNIIREVAKVAGGGGGGRAELAQAGGKDKSKLKEALALAPRLVRKA